MTPVKQPMVGQLRLLAVIEALREDGAIWPGPTWIASIYLEGSLMFGLALVKLGLSTGVGNDVSFVIYDQYGVRGVEVAEPYTLKMV